MKQIKYTPDAADRLRDIKNKVSQEYGKDKAKSVVGKIMKAINGLLQNENKGASVQNMFGITTEYRYLYVSPNYVFYRIEKYIRVINIYHEKEDFMWQLFRIDTTPQETIDYWKETD